MGGDWTVRLAWQVTKVERLHSAPHIRDGVMERKILSYQSTTVHLLTHLKNSFPFLYLKQNVIWSCQCVECWLPLDAVDWLDTVVDALQDRLLTLHAEQGQLDLTDLHRGVGGVPVQP